MASVTYLRGGIGQPDIENRMVELQGMLGVMFGRQAEAEAEARRCGEMIAQIKGGLIETEMWLARIGGGSGPATSAAPPEGESPEGEQPEGG